MRPNFRKDAGESRLPKVHGTLIFEASWAGSLEQKATTLGVGALFWAVWLALWVPFLTLLLWVLGPLWGASQFQPHAADNLATLGLIGLTGVLLGSLLSLWGTVQWLRGISAPAREVRANATLQDLSTFHAVPLDQLDAAWANRRLVIHHDDEGQVLLIETSLPKE